ncbi:CDP-glucose 4,6-dehydratase [Bradyrhizobium sp. BR13661]|uniref:CDP-glucose 4,6-dehydratase n=1 Tax=Bradyrhizobium sp. BR13661 TaxID=2940622 RepID=UPI002474E47D|nr:CDP-glucose 4,6-dehydratase [Bradyrhizobium sp. BR13661]MDH6264539.1 CDP-glucose 4,6-dehydratase [Bradyrhizobium sp. BR13661]
MDKSFWDGKRVLITGHTGFKGGWMSVWLHRVGARLFGISNGRVSNPDFYTACGVSSLYEKEYFEDVRDLVAMRASVSEARPDILIHMAAQPIVLYGMTNPAETFAVNVVGTANVLEAARAAPSLKSIVNVTTDKVYRNLEWVWPYREGDELGGKDPYSSSKSCADICARSFYRSYFQDLGVGMANVRGGNVIGGGDWARDRLVPDFFRALEVGAPITIRNPRSIRPWQHVLEPVSGYLKLAERLYGDPAKYSGDWNFGPRAQDCKPVEWIISYLRANAERKIDVFVEPASNDKEARLLKLDSSKAREGLDWESRLPIETALSYCLDWYVGYSNGRALKVTAAQIEEFNAR